jgi:hypothetical protein
MKQEREAFMAAAGALYDEVSEWRHSHPEASFDDIVAQVRPQRRALMGELLSMLALQGGSGEVAEGCRCAHCGEMMRYKGQLKRLAVHGEGESPLQRAHYYCPHCQRGVFPPGRAIEAGAA